MTVDEEFTYRLFEDLRKEAYKQKDFDQACKHLASYMGVRVARSCILNAYDRNVLRNGLMPIELITLQEKNDLKEMARKFSNSFHGVDYCKALHLFIFWMEKQPVNEVA